MLKRLRLKFICTNMLIVLSVLLVMFGLVFQVTRQDLETQSLRLMRSIAAEPFRMGRPGEVMEGVRLPYFVLQLRRDGELETAGGFYDLSDIEFLEELLEKAQATGEQEGILNEYGLRFCFGRSPWGQSLVFVDMSVEKATLQNLVRTCAGIGAISMVAFLLISIGLARWAVRPVEKAWTQQRQFVADASHELKTPLTVILTNAEMLQTPGYDEGLRSQFSESILTMALQMRGLVESLLELARADNGTLKTVMTQIDLSSLVADAMLPFEPLCFEQGMGLDCQAEPGILVKGSETHLRQVLEILLDNACKYGQGPGTISVQLRRQGRRCLLSVANPGPPLSPEDRKNIFKRFYRVDKARRMDHSYGLGLAIAESIVRAHRGRIWAESTNGSNIFFVELPSGAGVSA